ncbi:MAG: phage holin family protein [Firmicutes bacterium]|nr:phage holin family protein [Bacillota bacterium]MCM1478034.1 phage holin family protein [Bacteroides sp.]
MKNTMNVSVITISPSTLNSMLWLALMLTVDYFAVIAAVLIDLRSGTLKARRQDRPITSSGYRRSVEKASRYLTTLLALTVVDAMIVGAAMLLRSTMQWSVPVFPLFTTIGAVALALIEGKSVMENTQSHANFTDTAAKAADLLSHHDLRRLIEALKSLANVRE